MKNLSTQRTKFHKKKSPQNIFTGYSCLMEALETGLMKQSAIICCLCVFFIHATIAQKANFQFGVSASTSLGFLEANPILRNGDSKTGISLGGNIYYSASARTQLISGLGWEVVAISARDYSPLFGCDMTPGLTVDLFNSYFEYQDKVHYITIPIEVRHLLSRNYDHAFYIQAGVSTYVKFGVSGRSFLIECQTPREITDKYNPFYGFHLRGSFGAGYRTRIGKIQGFIQPVAQYSLNPIFQDFGKAHLLNIALRLGVEL